MKLLRDREFWMGTGLAVAVFWAGCAVMGFAIDGPINFWLGWLAYFLMFTGGRMFGRTLSENVPAQPKPGFWFRYECYAPLLNEGLLPSYVLDGMRNGDVLITKESAGHVVFLGKADVPQVRTDARQHLLRRSLDDLRRRREEASREVFESPFQSEPGKSGPGALR